MNALPPSPVVSPSFIFRPPEHSPLFGGSHNSPRRRPSWASASAPGNLSPTAPGNLFATTEGTPNSSRSEAGNGANRPSQSWPPRTPGRRSPPRSAFRHPLNPKPGCDPLMPSPEQVNELHYALLGLHSVKRKAEADASLASLALRESFRRSPGTTNTASTSSSSRDDEHQEWMFARVRRDHSLLRGRLRRYLDQDAELEAYGRALWGTSDLEAMLKAKTTLQLRGQLARGAMSLTEALRSKGAAVRFMRVYKAAIRARGTSPPPGNAAVGSIPRSPGGFTRPSLIPNTTNSINSGGGGRNAAGIRLLVNGIEHHDDDDGSDNAATAAAAAANDDDDEVVVIGEGLVVPDADNFELPSCCALQMGYARLLQGQVRRRRLDKCLELRIIRQRAKELRDDLHMLDRQEQWCEDRLSEHKDPSVAHNMTPRFAVPHPFPGRYTFIDDYPTPPYLRRRND